MREFGFYIGFHIAKERMFYDTSGSSSYIEDVISLLGVDTDQLVPVC